MYVLTACFEENKPYCQLSRACPAISMWPWGALGKLKLISIVDFIVRLTCLLNSSLRPAVYAKEVILIYMPA